MARTRTIKESAAKRLQRADGWVNTTSGLGTARDRSTTTTFIRDCYQSEPELEELFRFNAFARTIVSELPKEALRLGVEMEVSSDDPEPKDSDDAKERNMAKLLRQHKAVSKMLMARVWGRLYGRGAVVCNVKGAGAPNTPWEPGEGEVKELFVATGRELRVKSYYSDPMSEKFSTPATYWLTRYSMGQGVSQVEVHESRMIVFGGADTPPHAKAENQGSDDSVLVAAYEALKQEGSNWASISSMIGDLSVAVYKLQDYIDSLAGKGTTVINKRLAEMDATKGVFRCLVLDKDGEEMEFKERGAATGLGDLVDKGLLRLAAVARMPVTKLLGQSPAGMNATGESDQQNWYDAANVERTTQFDDPFVKLAHALDPSAEWKACWPSLHQETDTEKLDRLKKQGEIDKLYIDAEVLQPEEVALARFGEGSELGIEVDPEIREELLENGLEEALNPPDPIAPPTPGAPGAQSPQPGKDPREGAAGATPGADPVPEADA
jgi:phage-related protein (TIGR01555 family)